MSESLLSLSVNRFSLSQWVKIQCFEHKMDSKSRNTVPLSTAIRNVPWTLDSPSSSNFITKIAMIAVYVAPHPIKKSSKNASLYIPSPYSRAFPFPYTPPSGIFIFSPPSSRPHWYNFGKLFLPRIKGTLSQ